MTDDPAPHHPRRQPLPKLGGQLIGELWTQPEFAAVTTAPAATVRVTCHAQHPDPKRRGQLCGAQLGDVPNGSHYAGLSARRPSAPDGRIRLQCTRRDCRTWNVFEPPHE